MSTNDSPSIQAERRARPVRLGLLVDPRSGDSVLRAVETATAVWGGRYCPMIPVFRTAPSAWLKNRSTRRRPSAREIAQGYLRLFEPDYLVETVPGLGGALHFPKERVLSLNKVLEPGKGVRHGVDAAELYGALYAKEYRFLRRDSQPVMLPRLIDRGLELMSAAWFGAFPKDPAFAYMETAYLRALGAQKTELEFAGAYGSVAAWGGTPLLVGASELEVSRRSYGPELTLLIVDPKRPADVLDFWNLRALGWRVLPLPIGWEEAADRGVRQVIDHIARMSANPAIYGAGLMPAQSLPKARFETVVARFASSQARPHWHPRIWDDWGRHADHVGRPEIRAGETRGEVFLGDRHKMIELPVPDIARHFERAYGDPTPTWATAIVLKSYTPSDLATAFPDDLRDLSQLFRAPMGLVGLSREGIILETPAGRAFDLLEFPIGSEVFASWAKQHGFDYTESGAGRLLRQIIRGLGGLWGASLVRYVALLDALNKLAHREWEEERPAQEGDSKPRTKVRSGTISYERLLGVLGPLHARDEAPPTTPAERETQKRRQERWIRNHIDALVRKDVLRIGVLLQCPHCQQRTWYPLDGLKASLECERCLQHYPFPVGAPREGAWHYRPAGPFAVETYAQGAYGVLLALRYIITMEHPDGASWSTSFELKRGNDEPLEVDFGVFIRPDRMGGGETRLILGECKSGDCKFGPKDYKRARKLLKAFPGAAFFFCTTRAELTPAEKKAIGRIARSGRKEIIPDRPINPVVVLTRTELEATFPAPMCWKGHPRFTPEIEGRVNLRDDLDTLADATQQLHLDLPSIQTERREHFERQRAAIAARSAASPKPAEPVRQEAPSVEAVVPTVVPTAPSPADAG